jgi:hypothetical protein
VSTQSGFLVFGKNRGPESGYPGSLFWATGTRTYRPIPVVLGLVTGFRVLDLKNQLNYNFLIKNYTINHVNLGGKKKKKKPQNKPINFLKKQQQ